MNTPFTPLAERLRPYLAGDYVGQTHLLAADQPLRMMLNAGQLHSLLFWGPPGSGKTTLARILAKQAHADFYEISAISAGVKDLRQVIEQARHNREGLFARSTVLFIDEIHRFNKAQQDALLKSVETGDLILIGATTENPSFEVIPALLSRCQVFTLKSLEPTDLEQILDRALTTDDWLKEHPLEIEDRALLFHLAGGDARVMLNRFELAVQMAEQSRERPLKITNEILKQAFQRALRYDKAGEEHYNLISAFIKSVRGSDPDAAVYWLARMLTGGEKPEFIARRLVILASEDIGNAEPYALMLASSCFQAVHQVGMPEARILLSQVTTYLASCPKSNAAYLAIGEAMADVQKYQELPVPLHLRNAPTALMKNLGYGENYQYSHDQAEHFSEQQYLPDRLKKQVYYRPTTLGREKALRDRLNHLWPERNRGE